ncbi:secretin [Haemophilus paracuniculus]|uniref:Secretin n=1 Tax=Haemophilus paracuniculus TaxID=734 RepID=A0A1T0ATT2_9PAST|nr:type IV pilus secretin PilQ [Haemophilus paracuniculus]OOS00155.1 secretin [Haemophilus paracuniculus]
MQKRLWLLTLFALPLLANELSISLKNAPTAQLLSFLAEETGKNIVLADKIDSQTTLRIENSNFEQILNSITKINQLNASQQKNIYYVSHQKEEKSPAVSTARLKNSENLTARTQAQTPAKPKLLTKTIKINHAKASEIIDALTKGNGKVLSENGYLHFDERSNSLIIKDSATALANIQKLIKELDKPIPQIAIEARIVTISSENLQELGVRWGMLGRGENHQRFGGTLQGNSATNLDNLNVNFPVNNAASAVLQVATLNSRVLDLELSALEQENSVEIIASPRLLTTNKKPASIKQGTEIPYVLYSKKSEVANIEFKEAVLGLEVTPQLSQNNQILMDLLVTQNSPNPTSSAGNPLITIDKQELNTQVLAKHGETIVLGGIFQHLAAKGEDRVPILGSIPFIKRLFSQSRDKISKRELVIFVTPYVVQSSDVAVKTEKSRPN